MSILDTIDNAIADHELSTDAMRWTPEPSSNRPEPSREQVEAALSAHRRALADGLTAAYAKLGERVKAMQRTMQTW